MEGVGGYFLILNVDNKMGFIKQENAICILNFYNIQ